MAIRVKFARRGPAARKLSDEAIVEIWREFFVERQTQTEIARRHGVTQQAISGVVHLTSQLHRAIPMPADIAEARARLIAAYGGVE